MGQAPGGDWSRNSQQYDSLAAEPGQPKNLVMLQLGGGFNHTSKAAKDNHATNGYHDEQGTWHAHSQIPGREFTSGHLMGHCTSVESALQILVDRKAEPSVKGSKADCPAGHPGVYGFPLKSLSAEDIMTFLRESGAYKRGAVVIIKAKGYIMKGTGSTTLTDGQIGYHIQKSNKLCQIAAHETCCEQP